MLGSSEKKHQDISIIVNWYAGIMRSAGRQGMPRGSVAAALVVLERLKSKYDLNLASHRANGTGQIIGLSRTSVAKILAGFGEKRPFLNEGGRTNRGAPGAVQGLLSLLEQEHLERLTSGKRKLVLQSYQAYLVVKVREYHERKRIEFIYDMTASSYSHIHRLLETAKSLNKGAAVSQYLVGAKLQLRFRDQSIDNYSASTADNQLGRAGDYEVGDAVFHVTVSPGMSVLEKCQRNIQMGKRPFLLVPDGLVFGTKASAETTSPGKITVISIESFVSQNVEELGVFSRVNTAGELRKLLLIYNERVDEVETDKSLMVEIPDNLQ